MKKRSFLKTAALTLIGSTGLGRFNDNQLLGANLQGIHGINDADAVSSSKIISTCTKDNVTTVMLQGKQKPCVMMHVTDTHITVPCEEEDSKVWNYCKRMHQAYKNTTHHVSGENISRAESFRMLVDVAKRRKVDLLVLSGDIVNFPSPKTVDFVYKTLQESGVPYVYVAGNHDWHLEGTEGSDAEKRLRMIPVLKPLYQGKNPLYNSTMVNGVNVVCIDNSTYQINREQLDFFKQQIRKGFPVVLVMHIPVCTSQHHDSTMGYEKWGAAIDKIYKLEGREQWSAKGNDPETVEFHKLLMETKDILVLCGHVHTWRVEHERNLQQYVTSLSRDGAYRILDFKGTEE